MSFHLTIYLYHHGAAESNLYLVIFQKLAHICYLSGQFELVTQICFTIADLASLQGDSFHNGSKASSLTTDWSPWYSLKLVERRAL